MTQGAAPYRWNTSSAAEAYDAAAAEIHPYYTTVQDRILGQLASTFDAVGEFLLVDLGGGSGRLVERVLDRYPGATAVLVDQSGPFLAIAERRLGRFGPRAKIVQSRLQDDWRSQLPSAPQAIVSMSAIHHLLPAEKSEIYARCYQALAPGGVFINGDEFRPESDAEFRTMLERWSDHMQAGIDAGRIPADFQAIYDHWHNRNIDRFDEAKVSGEDCLETIEVQRGYLQSVGFKAAEMVWREQLWGVLRALS